MPSNREYMRDEKYASTLKKEIPDRAKVREMIDVLELWLPMTREQIVHRAVEKYYEYHRNNREVPKWQIRNHLMGIQHHECYYCHAYISHKTATIDHKLPYARGGTDAMENMCLACHKCNNEKGAMNEEEYKQVIHNRELEQKAWPDVQLS